MMKKLFFLRSSSGKGNSDAIPPRSSRDEQDTWERASRHTKAYRNSPKGFKSQEQAADIHCSGLRRSRSLSSAAFVIDGLGESNISSQKNPCRSPCSSTNSLQHRHHPFYTPDQQSGGRQYEAGDMQMHVLGGIGSAKSYHHSSESSSSSSSNVSSRVVDRYIYGEEHLQRSKQKSSSQKRSKLPLGVQHTAPTSPLNSIREKPKATSFREAKLTCRNFPSSKGLEAQVVDESPRSLARSVIERLSQTYVQPSLKDHNHNIPITIEDVYGGSLDRSSNPNAGATAPENIILDEHYKCIDAHSYADDLLGSRENILKLDGSKFVETDDDTDVELKKRSKEAEERVQLLSEELEQQSFLCDSELDVPSLGLAIRQLAKERMNLTHEISDLLQCQIRERASAREKIKLAKAELELQMRRLEKEKNELQAGLEKELDRRSSDWSFKLEKYQLEEKRLRERVRELAEQNVSLQREVSTFQERETDSRSLMMHSERRIKELTASLDEATEENRDFRKNLFELQEKYNGSLQDLECIRSTFEEKDRECKELQKSITRLLRTCGEQEKTIEGLRGGLSEAIEKQPSDKLNHLLKKLQMEQMRLTGVEFALRREVESIRLEASSLRQENICLLNRLKGNGKQIVAASFKLDSELRNRICILENQGLSMLSESTKLNSKLLDFIKGKAFPFAETRQGIESVSNVLDGQFTIECDIKIQGIRRGAESLARSLQKVSSLLHEKSSVADPESESAFLGAERLEKISEQSSKELVRTELRAETLMTSLLREKLYSKELEVEQLQAELATAVRSNDILKHEVQKTQDSLSCNNHKLTDLELQMLKKDEKMNQLQTDLEESMKELTNIKGILPKVSAERDMIWEELQQYKENNMLLNAEANMLKKKIETLDEDILLKEGQITILKDTLGNQRFDLLGSPNLSSDFLVG